MSINLYASGSYPASGIPLFGYFTKNINPASILTVNDASKFIPENNPQYERYSLISGVMETGSGYVLPDNLWNSPSGSLVITDKATKPHIIDYTLPLYYEYQLMYDHYASDPYYPEGFIVLRKNNENEVSKDMYRVERRDYPVSSGRYINQSPSGWLWRATTISGNVTTCRLLLPVRDYDMYRTVEYNRYRKYSESEYWSELVDEEQLYKEGRDYNVVSASSVLITTGGALSPSSVLYVQKDPETYIYGNYPGTSSDDYCDKEWCFSVSLGSLNFASGIYGNTLTSYVAQNDTNVSGLIEFDIPERITNNILRTTHRPLARASGLYPVGDTSYSFNDMISGCQVNGLYYDDYITSMDTRGGYVMFSKNFRREDEISINSYMTDVSGVIISRNIQLNPAKESGSIDAADEGLGLAIIASGNWSNFSDFGTPHSGRLDSTNFTGLVGYRLTDASGSLGDFSNPISGIMLSSDREYSPSGIIPSNSKFLGTITAKVTPEKNVETMDIRRTGGYREQQVMNNVSGWRSYSDVGFYDGEPFPMAGTALIQIPSGIYDNIYEIFKNDTDTDIENTQYQDYYKSIGDNVSNMNKEGLARVRANDYIKDVVERYLPAGTKYILLDEEMNYWGDIRTDA